MGVVTAKARADLLDEFLTHYRASKTRGPVDEYLAALRLLVGVPKNGQVQEDDRSH